MMKKKLGFIVALLVLTLTCTTLVGCKHGASFGIKGEFQPYSPPSNNVTVDDGTVKFDGTFDETVWSNATWHDMRSVKANRGLSSTMTLPDVNARGTVVLTDTGMYIGFDCDESIVYVGTTPAESLNPDYKTVWGKSGFTLYFTDQNGYLSGSEKAYEVGFAADGTTSFRYKENDPTFWMGNEYTSYGNNDIITGAKIRGTVNTATCEGYGIEAYIPWASLPSVGSNPRPQSIRAAFAMQRYPEPDRDVANTWEMLDRSGSLFGETIKNGTFLWSEYSSSGYVAPKEGAVFGTYGENLYDSGFNLSGDVAGANRQITFDSTLRRDSYVWVRDQFDTTQLITAKFAVGNSNTLGEVDKQPYMGFVFRSDVQSVSGREHVYDFSAGIDVLREPTAAQTKRNHFSFTFTSDNDDEHYFMDDSFGRRLSGNIPVSWTTDTTENAWKTFTLTAVREGDTFLTFLNDTLVDERVSDRITDSMKTYMGLFVANTTLTVTEYEALSGADAQTKIGQYLAARGNEKATAGRLSGDTRLTAAEAAVDANSITLAATKGNQLVANVKNVTPSNKVYVEFTAKNLLQPDDDFCQYVILSLKNTDGKSMYFGFQLDSAYGYNKVNDIRSWSSQSGFVSFGETSYGQGEPNTYNMESHTRDIANSNDAKNTLTNAYNGSGLKVALYIDGTYAYFYIDGKPIYNWVGWNGASGGSYIRTLEEELHIGSTNFTDIAVAVDNGKVQLSGLKVLTGNAAENSPFTVRSSDVRAENAVLDTSGIHNLNGADAYIATGDQSIFSVKDVTSSKKLYAETTVKLIGRNDTVANYIVMAVQNSANSRVYFGFKLDLNGSAAGENANLIDDVRSWSSKFNSGFIRFFNTNYGEGESNTYLMESHTRDITNSAAEKTALTNAYMGDGIKIAIYIDGTYAYFYLNGKPMYHWGGAYIRKLSDLNIDTQYDFTKIEISVANAECEFTDSTFAFGDDAATARNAAIAQTFGTAEKTVATTDGTQLVAGVPTAGSDTVFAEFTVKGETINAPQYVIVSFRNTDGKTVYFALQCDGANGNEAVNDFRSWSSQSDLQDGWTTSNDYLSYTYSRCLTEGSVDVSGYKTDGIKIIVYKDSTSYRFYINGTAPNAWGISSNIRPLGSYTVMDGTTPTNAGLNVGTSPVNSIRLIVTSGSVTFSGCTFKFGADATAAYAAANLTDVQLPAEVTA